MCIFLTRNSVCCSSSCSSTCASLSVFNFGAKAQPLQPQRSRSMWNLLNLPHHHATKVSHPNSRRPFYLPTCSLTPLFHLLVHLLPQTLGDPPDELFQGGFLSFKPALIPFCASHGRFSYSQAFYSPDLSVLLSYFSIHIF